MKLEPVQVAGALAKGLPPVWLIAGEEPLLIQESADLVRAAARAKGYAERIVLTVESGFRWQQVLDEVASLSLFASQRLIEVLMPKGPNGHRRSKGDDEGEAANGDAPTEDGTKLLPQIVARPAPDVLLLFIAGKIDWKARAGGWYAALENAGAAVYAEPLKPAELPRWIDARLSRAGISAEPDALALLAERTEGNLLAAQQEVDKLALLHGRGARLSLDAIEQAVADSAHFEAFDWINKLLLGDAQGAVHGFSRLRGEGMDPLAILGPLAFALRELAKAASNYSRLRDARAAVQGVRANRDSKAAYERAVERVTHNQVLGWLRKCAQVDRLAKSTGGGPAAWEELLTLVLAATKAAPRKAAVVRR